MSYNPDPSPPELPIREPSETPPLPPTEDPGSAPTENPIRDPDEAPPAPPTEIPQEQ